MRSTLGIAIGHGAVRGVVVRSGVVVATLETRTDDAPLEPAAIARAIAELAAEAPLRRWPRPAVAVAIGPAFARVRRLRRLPPLRDLAALDRLVREGAGRFFARNGVPLVTGRVAPIEPGVAWAAAFDEPVVQAIETACRAARLRLRLIAPAAAVLAAGLEDGDVAWTDGPVSATVSLVGGRMADVARHPAHLAPADPGPPRPRPPLARLGPDGWRFADAYGAALHGPDPGLTIRPGTAAMAAPPPPRWRLALAAAALALATAAAILAPGLAPLARAREASARIAAVAGQRHAAAVAELELGRFAAALGEVAAFAADRRSVTLLLEALAGALPEGAALVSLRVDGPAATVVALAPDAAALVAALEAARGITGPRIAGPVDREHAGGAELERVTVRFDLVPAALDPTEEP